MTTVEHPVWALYDRLRSVRLSSKYYAERLHRCETLDFWMSLVLAASAPSSAIAGLWFFETAVGRMAWQTLGVVAAIAALVKPLLQLTKRIKEYEGQASGYRMLDYDLMELKSLVEGRKKYDSTIGAELRRIQARERALIGKTPESREDKKLKKRCQDEVLRELPTSALFVPE